MYTKKAVALERLLPGFDPFRNDPKLPLLAPVEIPPRNRKHVREEQEFEDEQLDDEGFHYDGWSHASAKLIEYRVRGYNDEIEYLELELSCASDVQRRISIRLQIMNCMDERDELIIEHTHFFPERGYKLAEARRTRISKDPTRIIREYEERAANSPDDCEGKYGRSNIRNPSTKNSTDTVAKSRKGKNKGKTSRPISLKVVYRKHSFECTFTPGVKHPKG